VRTNFKNAVAYICGPEVMIKAAMRDLFFLGMPDDKIITTLESHMKCGVGKCGHCYAGPKYICTDGPVFSYKEIKEQSILK
jgi:NAD(P)H-flavin reductase